MIYGMTAESEACLICEVDISCQEISVCGVGMFCRHD